MIKAIIFDLGRVVVDFDHRIAAEKISRLCGYSEKEIYEMFFDSFLTKRFEKGQISTKEFFTSVKNKLKCKISYKEFLTIWNKIFYLTDNNLKVHEIIKKLKSRYRIFLLSNVNKEHFEYLKTMLNGVLDNFDGLILSYKVKSRKPERKIYDAARKLANAEFSNLVYTDDREDLIEAAAKLGIKSIHYQNPELLKKDFSSLGIKV